MGPPTGYQYEKIAPPKSPKDLLRFMHELLGGFFGRLLYVFQLVWKSGPLFLFLMSFIALFEGVMPIVGSLISQRILNELQNVITEQSNGKVFDLAMFFGSMVFILLISFFSYKILNKIVTRLSHAVNRIAGERMVRHVRIRIMK